MSSTISGSSATVCASTAPSLPYVEPSLSVILTLAAFLLLLNVLHSVLDTLLHVGLLAQIILGALLGSPLANIIPLSVEQAVQSLGYIGLIILVVEGGMSTRLDILSSPKSLSLAVITGCTGVALPIGLSMILLPFAFHFNYLESFAVGASLSSTSLGTTFAIISSAGKARGRPADSREKNPATDRSGTGLLNTRIGTILIGAALLDDIVGLVLSSVITTLGGSIGSSNDISAWSVARPIVTSAALLIVTVALCRLIVRPLVSLTGKHLATWSESPVSSHPLVISTFLTLWTSVLCAFVSIAYFIGSTVLLGAFCAGAFSVYAYERLVRTSGKPIAILNPQNAFQAIRPVQDYVLAPFFFASIGAAIPIKDLFKGETIWKGVLFSGLMAVAKVMACLPVLSTLMISRQTLLQAIRRVFGLSTTAQNSRSDVMQEPVSKRPWLPSLLLGFSLVARGEIGFLIINIARQSGLIGCDPYNIGTWAIVLCTIIGPCVIGILVRQRGLLDEIESDPKWGLVDR